MKKQKQREEHEKLTRQWEGNKESSGRRTTPKQMKQHEEEKNKVKVKRKEKEGKNGINRRSCVGKPM